METKSAMKFVLFACSIAVGLCSRTLLRAHQINSSVSAIATSQHHAHHAQTQVGILALRSAAPTNHGIRSQRSSSATETGDGNPAKVAYAVEKDAEKDAQGISSSASETYEGERNPPRVVFAEGKDATKSLFAAGKFFGAAKPVAEKSHWFTMKSAQKMATAANPEKVYFRPVSVTLRCVLALTCLFLATYTALALARNVDELSGRLKPSLITETLTVAARSTTYAPMMAALFLACRMYVLQSTRGLGEPQIWAKYCMIAATAGLFLEPLIVCILPLIVSHDEEPFEKLSGVAAQLDVHPQLFIYGEKYDRSFKFAWILQLIALLPIYGGVIGVIVAIFMYPVKNSVSPAVIATVILAAWYFMIYGMLFLARSRQQPEPEPEPANNLITSTQEQFSLGDNGLVKFFLNASYPMEAAAMFAVLFLGARLRAVQLGVEPQFWAQMCFFACVGALILLSVLNGVAGMGGVERLGYYGEKLYDADSTVMMVMKHLVAATLYSSLGAVIVSIFVLRAAEGRQTPPLSTTLQSLLQLSCQFFLVYGLHWFFAATRAFVCKANCTMIMESSVVAARTSVQFCPILAILFVSCRMRALQITQQKGDPQGWAQDAMDMILAATLLQIVCCLLLPIFTGIATKTDGEGNAEYDLKPLIGAYIVTCLKYFALFLIFGGVAIVGVSIFMITPETARSDNRLFSGTFEIIALLFTFMIVLLIVMVLSSAKVIGLAVKLAIESVDRILLGVDVEIGAARLSICQGFVNLANVVVQNPDGYKTPYLLSVGKVVVKLAMCKLLCSLGKVVEIEALILSNVDIIFEKSSSSSNVQDLLKHLEGDKKEANGGTVEVKGWSKEEGKEEQVHEAAEKPQPKSSGPEVILHRIDILEVGAKVASTYLEGRGLRVALGNIEFNDFQEQCGGQVEVSVVIKIIVETLMKTVLANTGVVGEAVKQAAHLAEEKIKRVCACRRRNS